MFTRVISSLTLTKQVADGMFPHIVGTNFRGDCSFVATLRALMHKRIPSGEGIRLAFSASSYSNHDLKGVPPNDCIYAFLRGQFITTRDHGIIHVHSFDNDEIQNDASFSVLDGGGVENFFNNDFVALPDVNRFLEQCSKVKARVYISEKRKSALIFIERADIKKWHLLQSLIPRYLPWYMQEQPLDDEETALVRTLTGRVADEYVNKIEEIAKRFDFRTQTIKQALKGFENIFEKRKLSEVRENIRHANNELARLENRFRDLYTRLADLTTQELGLIAKTHEGNDTAEESEFMTYFLCNKSLNLVEARDGRIKFIVTTTIANYDPDVAENALSKFGKSFFYRHYETNEPYENQEMTDERIHRLMKAILLDEVLKLRVCAAYSLDFSTGENYGLSCYDFPHEIMTDHTPNQHIQHYACLGGNGPIVRQAMINRDYVGAVSACCASAVNMNLTEANTGTFFMEQICSNNVGKIIQMPDGTTATPLDAVKWLEEQDAEKQKEKEEVHE